ncbi:hypothetical protein EON67_10975, partial [archaeon]
MARGGACTPTLPDATVCARVRHPPATFIALHRVLRAVLWAVQLTSQLDCAKFEYGIGVSLANVWAHKEA